MNLNFRDILLIPNLITIFRLLLAIPIAYISFNYNEINNSNSYIILLILAAFLSDLADGFFARRLNQVSEIGKLLDPLADKLLTAILIALFWMLGFVPLFYLVLLLSRDLLIFAGGILLARKTGYITPSNYFGKFTILSIGLFFLSVLLLGVTNNVSKLMLYFSSIMSVISIFVYLIRGLKILKNHGNI